jgi:hypothetical protein
MYWVEDDRVFSTRRNNNSSSGEQQPDDFRGSVADLAGRVASGELTITPDNPLPKHAHWSRQQRIYGPCPVLAKPVLLQVWDPMQSLLYCLRFYRQMMIQQQDQPTDASSSTAVTPLLKKLATDDMIQTFVWQFISLIGYYPAGSKPKSPPSTTSAAAATTTNRDLYMEEKKEDGFSMPQLLTTTTAPNNFVMAASTASPVHPCYNAAATAEGDESNNYGEVMSSLLLKLSRKDQDFCQRLYFCLRSTLKSMEISDGSSADTAAMNGGGSSRNLLVGQAQQPTLHHQQQQQQQSHHLLALFNCLKLLRSAELEASDGSSHLGCMMSVEQQWLANSSHNTSCISVSEKTTVTTNSVEGGDPTPAADTFQLSNGSSHKSEKRKLFRFFRRKKNKKLPSSDNTVSTMEATAATAPSPPITQSQQAPPRPLSPRRILSSSHSLLSHHHHSTPSPPLLENMSEFVKELDGICTSIEKKLLKSISQKITKWALQPWSASKSSVLSSLTEGMRQSLAVHSGNVTAAKTMESSSSESLTTKARRRGSRGGASPEAPFCLVNPLDSKELLVGIDPKECYILPSAHFPILLTFDATERRQQHHHVSESLSFPSLPTLPSLLQGRGGQDQSYRIKVEICNVISSAHRLVLHGAIGGVIQESMSSANGRSAHAFRQKLQFDTRSSYGPPRTFSLRLASIADDDEDYSMDRSSNSGSNPTNGGFGWIDLIPLWDRLERFQEPESYCTAKIYSMAVHTFDDQGKLITPTTANGEKVRPQRLECKVTIERVKDQARTVQPNHHHHHYHQPSPPPTYKRMLLYKHDDDLRQEAFAIQFVQTCDAILKASGLDLKLLTFGCIPVGANRGFIEWVHGAVPLSDICQKPFSSFFGTSAIAANASNTSEEKRSEEEDNDGDEDEDDNDDSEDDISMIAKAGVSSYESLYRMGVAGVGTAAATAMKNTQSSRQQAQLGPRGALANNPIQDFLRSIAFDPDAPYFVCRNVMDTYVKSCAGYCVITYLLGVGDRHLDNLLLHNQTGCFFHCDYSFLFGNDPKKYLPMRVTEDMIYGMGGRDSDNYAKFLSLAGCAFLTLRRPENVRFLLSLVRVMEAARLRDITSSASTDGGSGAAEVLLGMRQRLRLDLIEHQAVAFMEEVIESSISSKLWMAVDAIHSLGKRF